MERLKQHYELLRIKPGAELNEIRQAYLLAEQMLHKDRLADDPLVRHKAQERLRKINEAYGAIMDAYQEVQASLCEGDSHPGPNRSAVLPTGIDATETGGHEAVGSSGELESSGIPKEGGKSEDMQRSVAAGLQREEPPPDAPFSEAGGTPDNRADRTEEKVATGTVLPEEDETDIADPAGLLRKESYLLFSLVALVVFVMVITWIQAARKSTPPEVAVKSSVPEVAVKSSAPVESVQPSRETSEPQRTVLKSTDKPKARKSRPVRQPAARETVDAGAVMREAEQGTAKAQALLGYLFVTGKGVKKDSAAAVKWFRAAAAQGDAQAQDWLGYLYESGTGVPRDFPEAVRWYRLAADKGYADAQKNLGRMYAKGKGVDKNRHEAIKWLRKAATQGNEEAQRALEIWQED